NQLGKPMLVEVEGRKIGLSIRPDSLNIREYLLPGKGLHLDLGFEGQVQIHPVSALPTRAFPLPKISPNTDASNRIALQLPFAFTFLEMDALIQNSFVGLSIPLNKNYRLLPTQFRTQAYGERLGITVTFNAVSNQGDTLTGELFLAGKPLYDPIAQEIRVENLDFILKSESAKAVLGTLIKKGKIRKQLNQRLKIPFGEILSVSKNGIEERLSLETPWVKGSIQDLKIVPLGFYPTSTGLTIPLQATGTTAIQWK
uniref:DUF4403 family protein n=1 Tax=Algoriphagus sp. TaxID=1872435 RepID=UPI004047EB10